MSSTIARTIRIHELAKKITLSEGEFLARAHEFGYLKELSEVAPVSKMLCSVLKEKGCEVKGVSSTVGLITADEILEKFSRREIAKEQPAVTITPPPAPAPKKPKIPMVKTAGDVQREKDAAAAVARHPLFGEV